VTAPEAAAGREQMQVLVVDDDSALIRTLADILRLNGYTPLVAGNARDGLELAGRSAPALAVIDLRLPDMDGMELVKQLRRLSALTEVVVLTGNATVESAIAALREHSIDYLLKPVQVDRLLQVATVATERWQRRLAEERLRESDDRFRRVVASELMGIVFWNDAGVIYDANATALRLFQYRAEEVAAGALHRDAMIAPDGAAAYRASLEQLRRDGFAAPRESVVRRRDGTEVPVLIGASQLSERRGGVGFVLDITERKKAERSLEERARQQAAVARLGRRAVEAGGAGDLPALFRDACAMVSVTLDVRFTGVLELTASGAALVLRAGQGWPDDAPGFRLALEEEDTQSGFTLRHNAPTIVPDLSRELRFDGARVLREHGIQSGVTVPIPGSAERPYGVLSAHDTRPRDFSVDDLHFLQAVAHILGAAVAREQGEARSRQAQRLEAVGRLAGGIAHDFNNILAAIIGYGEAIQATLPAGHGTQADVQEILAASERGAGLTRQLLAFSRRQVLQPTAVDLNATVRGMDGMLGRLLGERVELVTELAEGLAEVRADPGQMEQVILNLCVNARDAMPAGGRLVIATRNVRSGPAGGADDRAARTAAASVELMVRDTGSGMDADTRARIFEPFFTTKSADEGTGLGLATVYGIVQQSGGEIAVESEPGRGTTFRILLPVTP
jgi:two-component system cell cycle sensor histidine kinase/response regulator CckA